MMTKHLQDRAVPVEVGWRVLFGVLLVSSCTGPVVRGQSGESSGGPGEVPRADAGFTLPSPPAASGSDPPSGAAVCGRLVARARDFQSSHPDFEKDELRTGGVLRGLVNVDLDSDGKPVHATPGPTPSTTGAGNFAQWYRDIPGVNLRFEVPLTLIEQRPGSFVYDNPAFFPLDGRGWPGDERAGHNFSFTTEINTTFKYRGGERFTFTGDDDVFVFVNRKLAVDLGGVHGKQAGSVDLDQQRAALGITVGQSYALDIFHAERHTTQSNFRIETSIDCLVVSVD